MKAVGATTLQHKEANPELYTPAGSGYNILQQLLNQRG
jgi:hypothetical protein